jgi:hypothetical protein
MKGLVVCLLLALAGCKPGADKDDRAPAAGKPSTEIEVRRDATGETVVSLSPEAQKRIDLKVAALEAAERQPEKIAYGMVLDTASLAGSHSEIMLDQTALEAAEKVTQRAKALFEQDENVSRKTLEAAESDERTARIKLQAAKQSMALEWGSGLAGLRGPELGKMIEGIAARKTALAQVELPMGETMTAPPESIRVSLAGREGEYAAALISPAPKTNPKTLGQGFLLRVEDADASLAPGAELKARLREAGPAQKGALVPETAIVRSGGKTWVYLAEADNKFRRHEIKLEGPMEQGWLATQGAAVSERVVVQAAQILLSEEQKAEIQGD